MVKKKWGRQVATRQGLPVVVVWVQRCFFHGGWGVVGKGGGSRRARSSMGAAARVLCQRWTLVDDGCSQGLFQYGRHVASSLWPKGAHLHTEHGGVQPVAASPAPPLAPPAPPSTRGHGGATHRGVRLACPWPQFGQRAPPTTAAVSHITAGARSRHRRVGRAHTAAPRPATPCALKPTATRKRTT